MSHQVHDEIIAEGPEESTAEAMTIVKQCMQRPFKQVPSFCSRPSLPDPKNHASHFSNNLHPSLEIRLTSQPLLVDLAVDAKAARTWFEAK